MHDEDVSDFVCDDSPAQGKVLEQILTKVIAMDQKMNEILFLLRDDKSIDNDSQGYYVAPTENDSLETSHRMIENRADLVAFEAKLKNNKYKAKMQQIIDLKFKSMEKY